MLLKTSPLFTLAGIACALALSGCAMTQGRTSAPVDILEPTVTRSTPEPPRISEAERLLAEKQRHCLEDKRRLEIMLKEQQKRTEEQQRRGDELQQKLNALLNIDRDIRSRGKNH